MGKHDINDSLERPGLNKDVKVVVVGPAKSGKTALVQRFVNDTFSSVSLFFIFGLQNSIQTFIDHLIVSISSREWSSFRNVRFISELSANPAISFRNETKHFLRYHFSLVA